MAKSIRSKRMRKMRAIKREKVYGPKEMARLRKTVQGLDSGAGGGGADGGSAIVDAEMRELATVRDSADVVKEIEARQRQRLEASAYDPKTLRDEHGCYPPWMNQRRIRQHQAKMAKAASGKKATARATVPKLGAQGKKRIKKKSVW